MTIEEIRKEAEGRTTLNDCRLYQGRLANEQASHVRHLLKMVDALAGGANEDCPHDCFDDDETRALLGCDEECSMDHPECWLKWADAQAGKPDGR